MKYTYLTYVKNNQTYKCIIYGKIGYWCIPEDDRPFFIPAHLIDQGLCKIEKEVEE